MQMWANEKYVLKTKKNMFTSFVSGHVKTRLAEDSASSLAALLVTAAAV